MSLFLSFFIILIKIGIVIGAVLTIVAIMTWVERRGSALIQDRLGPNRVGPFGLLQPVADGLKFLFKEEIIPAEANKFIYLLSPLLVFVPALAIFAVIPFGIKFKIFGIEIEPLISDLNFGILYVIALSGLSIYGIVLAGYSSGSKYPLLGALRSSAQLISYEIPMSLSILAVLIDSGSFSLKQIVHSQTGENFGFLPKWFVFSQFIGFFVFLITMFAETNRIPFDLPEAEAELVAGYHTEYSSMKFALFFLGEYAHMVSASAIITILFFGGWDIPFINLNGNWGAILSFISFSIKTGFFLWLFVWVRWTLPRFRYDQLMALGWKFLLPLSILNLVWVILKENIFLWLQ